MLYQDQTTLSQPVSSGVINQTFGAVMRQVYLWMAVGLLLTAGVAAFVTASPLIAIVENNPFFLFGLLIVEVVLVFGIAMGINRLSPTVAVGLFLLYAALNGVTLSLIFAVYTLGSIALAAVATAGLFGAMSIIGYTTRVDLTRYGSYFLMALIGLFIAVIVDAFWANSIFDWIVTLAAILLFIGLTAYDTQSIKQQMMVALNQGDDKLIARSAILGALRLYLDLINLFLWLLRLIGRRR
jgi:FtsH-binding integral membrane protein